MANRLAKATSLYESQILSFKGLFCEESDETHMSLVQKPNLKKKRELMITGKRLNLLSLH